MPRRAAGSAGRTAPLRPAVVGPLALALGGCGGGLPLLHPAQVLAAGDVRASAGVSATVAAGALASAIADARSRVTLAPVGAGASPAIPPAGPDPAFARGAVAFAAAAPGIAPVAGARVGLGQEFEAGLAYTGRAVRADVRRAFGLSGTWALSVGMGGSAALGGGGSQDDGAVPDLDLARLHGWGADVPVLIGYESAGDLYMVWVGARAGWEHVDDAGGAPSGGAAPVAPPPALSATIVSGGGLVGLAAGFRHLHVAMELDVSYASVTGDYGAAQPQHVRIEGLTLAPASVLWWRF